MPDRVDESIAAKLAADYFGDVLISWPQVVEFVRLELLRAGAVVLPLETERQQRAASDWLLHQLGA